MKMEDVAKHGKNKGAGLKAQGARHKADDEIIGNKSSRRAQGAGGREIALC